MAGGFLPNNTPAGVGLKRTVLRKENVFTCVTFGALFLFVISESVINPDNLATTAFLIAVSVFLLSLFKLFADVAEDINDRLTNYLRTFGQYRGYDGLKLRSLREAPESGVEAILEDMTAELKDSIRQKDELQSYRAAYLARASARKIRRALLYVYYFVFMLLFALLLLHSELTPFLEQSGLLVSVNINLLTLWSLVVVLFEVMMKGMFEKTIAALLEHKLGFRLGWY